MKKPITDWDKYRFQFVRERLRKASFMWPPRGQAIRAARTTQKPNPTTGRLCWYVECAGCHKEFLEKEVRLDHVEPVVAVTESFMPSVRDAVQTNIADVHMGTYLRRMLPEAAGFQCLCESCHTTKTRGENEQRKQFRKARSKG